MVTILVEGSSDKDIISSLLDHMGLLQQCELFDLCQMSTEKRWEIILDATRRGDKLAIIVDADYCKENKITDLTPVDESKVKELFWQQFESIDAFKANQTIKESPFHIIGYEKDNNTHAGEIECLIVPKELHQSVMDCVQQYEQCIDTKLNSFIPGGTACPPIYRELFRAPIPFKEKAKNTTFNGKFKKHLINILNELKGNNALQLLFEQPTFNRLKTFLSDTIK